MFFCNFSFIIDLFFTISKINQHVPQKMEKMSPLYTTGALFCFKAPRLQLSANRYQVQKRAERQMKDTKKALEKPRK
jgi:hypothetical protein